MLKRVDRKPALSCSKYYSEMSRVPKHRSSFTSSVHDVSCHNNSFYLSLGGLPLHSSLLLSLFPFLFAFRDDSHLAFFFCSFPFAALSLMVLVYDATRFSTFLFSLSIIFLMNCCGMAKANMATVRFKTP